MNILQESQLSQIINPLGLKYGCNKCNNKILDEYFYREGKDGKDGEIVAKIDYNKEGIEIITYKKKFSRRLKKVKDNIEGVLGKKIILN